MGSTCQHVTYDWSVDHHVVKRFSSMLENAMAFIPIEDVAEVVMSYRFPGGNVAKNVFNVREAGLGGWDAASLTSLTDTFIDWETNTAKTLRSNQVVCFSVAARDLSTQAGAVIERGVNIVGAANNFMLPAQVTLAVKSVTGFAGRSFRGRHYWIGLWETSVSGDFVDTTVANNIVAALNTLRTLLPNGTPTSRLVVASRYANGQPRAAGVANDILTYQLVDNRVDTQRRRLIGEGQ